MQSASNFTSDVSRTQGDLQNFDFRECEGYMWQICRKESCLLRQACSKYPWYAAVEEPHDDTTAVSRQNLETSPTVKYDGSFLTHNIPM